MSSEHLSTPNLSAHQGADKGVQHTRINILDERGVLATVLDGKNSVIASCQLRFGRLTARVLARAAANALPKAQKLPAVAMNVILEED